MRGFSVHRKWELEGMGTGAETGRFHGHGMESRVSHPLLGRWGCVISSGQWAVSRRFATSSSRHRRASVTAAHAPFPAKVAPGASFELVEDPLRAASIPEVPCGERPARQCWGLRST